MGREGREKKGRQREREPNPDGTNSSPKERKHPDGLATIYERANPHYESDRNIHEEGPGLDWCAPQGVSGQMDISHRRHPWVPILLGT